MIPYTYDKIKGWIRDIENLIALVATQNGGIVGISSIKKHAHPRLRDTGEFIKYLYQDYKNPGLSVERSRRLLEKAKKAENG